MLSGSKSCTIWYTFAYVMLYFKTCLILFIIHIPINTFVLNMVSEYFNFVSVADMWNSLFFQFSFSKQLQNVVIHYTYIYSLFVMYILFSFKLP